MAIVVNKYRNNEDVYDNRYYRGIEVEITLGKRMSSTWLYRNETNNSNLVWFGTATSAFMGYAYSMESKYDSEGNEHVSFELHMAPAISAEFLVAQSSDGRDTRLGTDEAKGIFGECSRAAWMEIFEPGGSSDLQIRDPNELLELISVKEVPEQKPHLNHSQVIAWCPEDVYICTSEWLLKNPLVPSNSSLLMQIKDEFAQEESMRKICFLSSGAPDLIEAKKHGFVILQRLHRYSNVEGILQCYPNMNGEIRVIDLPFDD